MLRRVMAGSALSALLTLALFAGTASAHKRTFETTLQLKVDAISDTVNEFSGRVVSERDKCKRYRTINVDAFDSLIATAISLRNGDWLVYGNRPPKGTTLIAFTPKKFLKRSKKHRHKCASDFAEKKSP